MAVKVLALFVLVAACMKKASGHGYMLEPPGRASLWRFDWTQPANYEDNQLFCGGRQAQFGENGGQCGPCGDNFADPVPRANENTGTFGNGVVARTFKSGSVIDTQIVVTANHLGTFRYSLCILPDPNKPELEECFNDIKLEDGSPVYQVNDKDYQVTNRVQLPAGLTCDRCVLRWHYRTGNSWGICTNGAQAMGCGDQETFRACADIAIV